jgi:hypothetical protein
MEIEEVLHLLEQRSKEHADRGNCTHAEKLTPEARIALQIHSSLARELQNIIFEVRQRLLQDNVVSSGHGKRIRRTPQSTEASPTTQAKNTTGRIGKNTPVITR